MGDFDLAFGPVDDDRRRATSVLRLLRVVGATVAEPKYVTIIQTFICISKFPFSKQTLKRTCLNMHSRNSALLISKMTNIRQLNYGENE
jgi:hypothetical protein